MNDIQAYFSDLQNAIEKLPQDLIESVIGTLYRVRLNGGQVFIMGNGGSASTASHFVCDLAKNTRIQGWPPFRVIGLTDNMASFSAYANDEGYDSVFAQQLANLVREKDIVIGISTSGNSMNVVRAVELGLERGAYTIAFTGFSGGKLAAVADLEIRVASDCIEHVEDIHLMLEHLITKALRERLARAPIEELALGVVGDGTDSLKVLAGRGNGPDWRLQLNELQRGLGEPTNLGNLVERALLLAVEAVGARSGSIMVLGPEGGILEGAVAFAGKVVRSEYQQLEETVHHGLAGWVYRHGEPALVDDTQQDDRWLVRQWDHQNGSSRSAMSVPLIVRHQIVGVLTLVNSAEQRFTEADLAFLSAIAFMLSLNSADLLFRMEQAGGDGAGEPVGVPADDLQNA